MTTINVDADTHEHIITLQSVLTLMSGDKPSISETVKYAASNVLSGTTFAIGTTNAFATNTCNSTVGWSTTPTSTGDVSQTSNKIFFARSL